MLRYILLRLLLLLPVMLAVSLLVFVLLHLGSTDPALDYLRLSHIPPTDAAVAEVRQAGAGSAPVPAILDLAVQGAAAGFRYLLPDRSAGA